MFKMLKDAVKITNDNIIIITPLILFMFVFNLYLMYSKSSVSNIALGILSFVTVVLMVSAFFAGWFYMIKKAIKHSYEVYVLEQDYSKGTFALVKSIPTGIGKYFLSYLGMVCFAIFLIACVWFLIFSIGTHFIGNLSIDANQINTIANATDMKTVEALLSQPQIMQLYHWAVLIMCITAIVSFLTMLWIPEIIYSTKNPFFALFKSIGRIFQKPLKTFGLYLIITIINFVLSFISSISVVNPIIYLFCAVFYFYFFVYLVVLLFLYYEREFKQ